MSERLIVVIVVCTLWLVGLMPAEGGFIVSRAEILPGEAMRVEVRPQRGAAPHVVMRMEWMDAEGERLHQALELVREGAFDLAQVFPGLRSRRTVSYVQLHVDGVPTGPALTIQPMLDAVVPMTVEGYRSDGSTYPRVAGWRTQQELAAMSRGDDDDDEGDEDGADDRGEMPEGFDPDHLTMLDRGRPAEEALADPSRRLRGYRMYLERDVLLDTSAGAIRIVLRPDHAPETVWNFRVLVQRGFYDGLTFFRIVPMTVDGLPFIIQAGDPTGRGHGGPGYALPLEPSGLAHDFGVISMARGDEPDSAGSQFFIALSREGTAMLDGQYSAFGYAVSGREAILAIADGQLEDMQRGRPRVPVVIHQARPVDATPRLTGRGRVEQRVQRAAARRDEPPLPPQRIPR